LKKKAQSSACYIRIWGDIYQLKNEAGVTMEDKNQVAVIIQRLYQNLPGAQSPRSPWSYQVFQAGNVLSVEQQLHMCFPNEEIRKAIFSIPKDKSPGNYGFFGSFFKAAWQDIGLWHAMLFKNLL